ncbi:antitermination protein NusG [Rhodopirellula sp.]|jgi:transcriptional antiterminator RfaH|nr:antitermination protein NusG [Rhodopirellula sp.]
MSILSSIHLTEVKAFTMPILAAEPDCYPENLFDISDVAEKPWWLLYTKSRQEKQLMRHLRQLELDHYGPQIASRKRSPSGRVRTSYMPLFANYVFLCGEEMARYQAVCTGCVLKATEVVNTHEFVQDLKQVYDLIQMGIPLNLESRFAAGQKVRIKNGPFMGYEGFVIRRENETRLLVSVKFMEQGVSAKLDDCQLEAVA